MLVGVENPAPVVTDAAYAANFSNERSVDGGYRVLKNVTGLWLLQRCVEKWGGEPEAASVGGPIVDPNDERFARAADVPAAIAEATGIPADDHRAITRCIFDSIAAAVSRVIGELEHVTGTPITEVDMFGGGAHIPLLVSLVEDATGLPVTVGSPEATALGNALVQGRVLGRHTPSA